MKWIQTGAAALLFLVGIGVAVATLGSDRQQQQQQHSDTSIAEAHVPAWSDDDLAFFLHGSMSAEFVPERVLRAFMTTYPQLFPTRDFSHLGLIADDSFGWPIGFTRGKPAHLAGMQSIGINCAACHVAEIDFAGMPQAPRARVLGVTSHFDAEAFYNAIIGATFQTAEPANMKKFLAAFLTEDSSELAGKQFDELWSSQELKITAAISAELNDAKKPGDRGLLQLNADNFAVNRDALAAGGVDLAELSRAMLQLFHNMRWALHIPDQPPEQLPPASGPGRNDAFGLLSFELFGTAQPHAPVKYGLVWNMRQRHWVHWDGNTQSPIGRNLLASLGLGAPLVAKHAQLDYALIDRHTALTEEIRSPRYPFPIDRAAASRGAAIFQNECASCHAGPETDERLYSVEQIGTDPTRAEAFSAAQAEHFSKFLSELQTVGYTPSAEPGIRSTQKYWSPTLAGVWERSPYLHNGSVRTMRDLLTKPDQRPRSFHRGSRAYDANVMGYADDGPYLLDTTKPGDSNAGHDFGTKLTEEQKRDLMEYLKTL